LQEIQIFLQALLLFISRTKVEPSCDVWVCVFQPVESAAEDKKKAKNEKVKKCIRTAAGTSWEDPSLLEWESGKAVFT